MKDGELTTTIVKTRLEYGESDRIKIVKNYKENFFQCMVLALMNTTESLHVILPKRFGIVFK